MKDVIFAIDDEIKFKSLKKLFNKYNYNVFDKDLIYEDAIFEIIENKLKINNIEFILIKSSVIENEKRFRKLLNLRIKILLFINEDEDVETYKKCGFEYVFDKSDLNSFFIENSVINKNIPQKKRSENNILDIKREIKNFEFFNKFEENIFAEIIVFTGEPKCGKTSLAINTLNMIKENKKILYIDFSFRNYDLMYVYNINNYNEIFYEKVINNNRITFLFNINLLLNINQSKIKNDKKRNYNNNLNSLKRLIIEYRKKYDLIIIDLDKNTDYKLLKCIFLLSTKVFFIVEPISLEINNSLNLINYFFSKKIIDEEKIFIIFNKYDYNSISQEILKEVFRKYKIECIVKRKMKYRRILNKEIKYGYRIRE